MLVLVGAAVWALRGQLPAVVELARHTRPRWSFVALATLLALATYALLIDNWRRVLGEMGGVIGYRDAAVIWLSSSLARYLPGAFWQFGAMTEMTRRRGVPVTVSTGGAVLITIVNLMTGLAVFALTSVASPGLSTRGQWIIGIGALGLIVAPFVVPRMLVVASRITRRELVLPKFGVRPVLLAATATAIAWLAYGVAFWLLTLALLPGERPLVGCIALYTGSYLAGLLNPAPAGLGAAEGAMVALASQLGVGTAAEAAVLAIAVRVWRTMLDVVPGAVAIAAHRGAPSRDSVA